MLFRSQLAALRSVTTSSGNTRQAEEIAGLLIAQVQEFLAQVAFQLEISYSQAHAPSEDPFYVQQHINKAAAGVHSHASNLRKHSVHSFSVTHPQAH